MIQLQLRGWGLGWGVRVHWHAEWWTRIDYACCFQTVGLRAGFGRGGAGGGVLVCR